MNMSADEILAANLWPWPDPLLKRDRNGQVLFVNAAFLQLYGGRIEDWRGNMVSGWPAPAAQGAQRFETRAGETPHETVYDWVEMVMADGHAMAIARNVTALIPAPTPPGNITVPQNMHNIPASPPVQEAPPVAAPETAAPAQEPVFTPPPVAPPPPAPIQEPVPSLDSPPPALTPVAEIVGVEEQAPDLNTDLEDTLNRSAEDYLTEQPKAQPAATAAPAPASETTTTSEAPAPEAPAAAPEMEEPEQEKSRMFERRALPIEDSTAVLGSNWRDQVIAKAVGAETPEEAEDDEDAPAPVEAEPSAELDPGAKVGDGLRILLAEDNAINALLTRTLLEAEGAVVDTVEDGALAVKAVQTEQYDLIFMDMRMPNMDGLESTRKIRALGGRNKDLPIVALTANAFDDDRNACFDSGMNDFMTKPVSAEELQEMVHNWTKEKEEEKLAS